MATAKKTQAVKKTVAKKKTPVKVKKNAFVETVTKTPVVTRTTNGMKAFKSTMNANVDLFASIGASRGKDITSAFLKAYVEDQDTALRIAQWARDVRGGAGERDIFRTILRYLNRNEAQVLTDTKFLNNVPVIGRWDDLLVLLDIKDANDRVRAKVVSVIKQGLDAGDGLCAKWMPRKGPVAVYLREQFGWTPKRYRKTLVELTKVVETQMCAKKWDDINFNHVPSQAMSKYMTAFHKNATDRFVKYREALKRGDKGVKVNAGAVYPHDVIRSLRHGQTEVSDAMWKALPNYMSDANILPMVDVSGSMHCAAGPGSAVSCIDVALALGLYCADKNTGAFKDMFLTFSGTPELLKLKGTLSQKMAQMETSSWAMNTDLNSAFKKILSVAVAGKVPQEDMPSVVLILSDMQFDQCADYSAQEMIEKAYAAKGYTAPVVVFWNLNAAYGNQPVKFDKKGTVLVSGFSPTIMKPILSCDLDDVSPEKAMLEALRVPRYDYL